MQFRLEQFITDSACTDYEIIFVIIQGTFGLKIWTQTQYSVLFWRIEMN